MQGIGDERTAGESLISPVDGGTIRPACESSTTDDGTIGLNDELRAD